MKAQWKAHRARWLHSKMLHLSGIATWAMSHAYGFLILYIRAPRPSHIFSLASSCVSHHPFVVSGAPFQNAASFWYLFMWYGLFVVMRVPWLMRITSVTHSSVHHHPFVVSGAPFQHAVSFWYSCKYVALLILIHVCPMTYTHVLCDSVLCMTSHSRSLGRSIWKCCISLVFIYVVWLILIHVYSMTHTHFFQGAFMCIPLPNRSLGCSIWKCCIFLLFVYVAWLILVHISSVAYSCVSLDDPCEVSCARTRMSERYLFIYIYIYKYILCICIDMYTYILKQSGVKRSRVSWSEIHSSILLTNAPTHTHTHTHLCVPWLIPCLVCSLSKSCIFLLFLYMA